MIYLDYSNPEGYELSANSYILEGETLPETILDYEYKSVEVYRGFDEFPPRVLEKIFCQLVIGGQIILLHQPSVVKHLAHLNRLHIENAFSIKFIQENIYDKSDMWKAISRSDQQIFERINGKQYLKVSDRFEATTKLIILTKTNNQEELLASKEVFDSIWNTNDETVGAITVTAKRPASAENQKQGTKKRKECHHQDDVKERERRSTEDIVQDNIKEGKKRSTEDTFVPVRKKRIDEIDKIGGNFIDLTDEIEEEAKPMLKTIQSGWLKFAETCRTVQGFEIFEIIIGNSSSKARIRLEQEEISEELIQTKPLGQLIENSKIDATELRHYFDEFRNIEMEKKQLFVDPPIWIIENFLLNEELEWVLTSTQNHADQFKKSFTENEKGQRLESRERNSTYLELQKSSHVLESIKLKASKIMGIQRSFHFI